MFWDDLSPHDQAAVLAIGTRRSYPRGAYLFLEGEASTHVIVVLSGSLKLTRTTSEGRGVVIEFRSAGELVGEVSAIDRQPRSASASARTPVEALTMPADRFRELLAERGTVATAVLAMMAARIRETSERRLESGTSDAVTRLASRLVELAERQGPAESGAITLVSSLTQQELAEWIGVSRDAVVQALRQLRKLKLIETGRQQIRILDVDALRSFGH